MTDFMPREKHMRTGKPLKGFAIDLTITAPEPGIYFVHDRFAQSNPIPLNTWDQVGTLIEDQLERLSRDRWPDANW